MNFKTTLVLLVLLGAVAAYFLLVERDAQTTYEREKIEAEASQQEGTPLFDSDQAFSVEDVTELTIDRDDEHLVLTKVGKDWKQTAPVEFPLNNYSAEQIARQASQLRYVDQFTPGSKGMPSLADAALSPARVTLTLKTKDGEHTLKIGKRSLGGRAYAALGDEEQVYIVNDALHKTLLTGKIGDWRRKSIDAPEATGVAHVSLQYNGTTIELNKADSRWFLDANHTQRASESSVSSLISAVGSVRAAAFVTDQADALASFGLTTPSLQITLTEPALSDDNGDGATDGEDAATQTAAAEPMSYTLRIGTPADLKEEQFFATWSKGDALSPVVFLVNKSSLDGLKKSANDLRDPKMLTTKAADVRELKLTRDGKTTLELVRDPDAGFTFGSLNPGYDADYSAVTGLLDTLEQTEAVDYVADFKPAAAPLATLTLTTRATGLSEQVAIYAGDHENPYVTVREGEPVGYVIPAGKLEPLFQPLLTLRDKDVLRIKADELAGVTLDRGDGVSYRFTRTKRTVEEAATQPASPLGEQSGDWQLQGVDQFEKADFESLVKAITPLRVEKWLTEAAQPGDNWIVLTLELAEGSPRVLKVNPETGRAVLDGVDAAFEVSQSLRDKLTTEYYDRNVLSLDVDNIESITVTEGDTTLVIERDSEGNYAAASGQSLDDSAVGGLFDTLTGLHVTRYLAALQVQPEELGRTFAIKTKDGKTYHIRLIAAADRNNVAIFDEAEMSYATSFTLSDDTLKKLRANLVKQDDAASTE